MSVGGSAILFAIQLKKVSYNDYYDFEFPVHA